MSRSWILVASVTLATWVLVGCSTTATPSGSPYAEPYLTALDNLQPVSLAQGEKLRVVATTSIVSDVVAHVGGDAIDLHSLIPVGADPHAFEPTPQDAQALTQADAIIINGFGLEAFMADLIRETGGSAPVISASLGIEPIPFSGEEATLSGADPHTWLDPNNVIHWTENIEAALTALDPAQADTYAANAASYRAALAELDRQMRQIFSGIPTENRKLVTDHDKLGYFADEYGFTVVGTVIPGASSLAEPSAAQLAQLLDQVKAQHVPAVFVSSVVNPTLVDTFAADAGIHVVTLYAHSLTEPGGAAPSYLELMRYNAEAIAAALTP
jgi:ABC-type Zn uptake system ZnuABC Zn-binding protein ZnuA